MDIDILEEKIKNLEDELKKFEKEEACKIEKIEKDIDSLDKSVKKDILLELKLWQNEKKKSNNTFLNNTYQIKNMFEEITNEIKHTFVSLNTKRQYLFKCLFDKIANFKNNAILYYNKYIIIQKEIDSLFESINNNTITDIYILNQNSLLFQKELVNMFQRFYYQMENSIME
ncbi:hypothetical protein PFTANZ_05156 [Plasmodium falciparum Tanzania (2000708)]|uniref:Uncharacterized protein n=1 Tax=Plasmodium falciparum Tanzania (2000708) TaxID=1036725 RepID=A0A024W0M5_PLAFA|nr:hypothetical protein PFTANZ_05156 [Plasmodium falciparum Tanzania (2000708)]